MLVPTLSPGEIVLMDNLGSHKRAGVRKAIEAAGAAVCFLPAYSPDLDPRSSPSSKTHCAKWHTEPSMHSGTQSELPSMTFPQKNASTIFAMPDMGPPNQDTL
jgi:DDE superfamily endonuclease